MAVATDGSGARSALHESDSVAGVHTALPRCLVSALILIFVNDSS